MFGSCLLPSPPSLPPVTRTGTKYVSFPCLMCHRICSVWRGLGGERKHRNHHDLRSRFRIDNQESGTFNASSIPEISGKSRFRIASPISISYPLPLRRLSSSCCSIFFCWDRLLMALTSRRPRRCRWTCPLIWTASTILNSRWDGEGRFGRGGGVRWYLCRSTVHSEQIS